MMTAIPADLRDFADALRAELSRHGAVEELLVDTVIVAAIRLKVLFRDPRAFDPFDVTWTRAHDAALRAFFRAHNTLTRRRAPRSDPPTVPPDPRPAPSRPASAPPPVSGNSVPTQNAATPAPSTTNASAAPPPTPSAPSVGSPSKPAASEPTFDQILRTPLRRDPRSRGRKAVETHFFRNVFDRLVPVSATPSPRASPS